MSAERGPVELTEWAADRITLEVLSERTGVQPRRIHTYIEFGLLEPAERQEERLYFEVAAILRLRRIERLRRDLRVNLTGIAIILDMRERLLQLQRELERREP
jgi:DNA-binding transcriptional MerR regulator